MISKGIIINWNDFLIFQNIKFLLNYPLNYVYEL